MFHSRCPNARERLCTGFEAKVIRVFFESSTDHLWVFSTGRIRYIVVVNQTVSPPVEGGGGGSCLWIDFPVREYHSQR